MMEMQRQMSSHRWWFDSHSGSRRSPWLQSTLAELDRKTDAMLKIIEEDADSFAKRAEMYYKKRPELISLVEDFYRAHRSLVERYDLLKSDSGTPRVLTNLRSPFSFKKSLSDKSMSVMDQAYSTYSYASDFEESAESEVEDPEQIDEMQVDKQMNSEVSIEVDNDAESLIEDPEQEDETHIDKQMGEEVSSKFHNDEMMKLREEIAKLRDANKIQKEQLMQKDEEKREVIRQLSLAVGMLKDENSKLRKFVATTTTRDSSNKWGHFDFNKLKGGFLCKLFNGSAKSQSSIVAL